MKDGWVTGEAEQTGDRLPIRVVVEIDEAALEARLPSFASDASDTANAAVQMGRLGAASKVRNAAARLAFDAAHEALRGVRERSKAPAAAPPADPLARYRTPKGTHTRPSPYADVPA